jgi:hypothetical protein
MGNFGFTRLTMARTRGKPPPSPQNVISSKSRIDESNNLCGLELTMVTVYNSNDDIIPNTIF